MKTTIVYRMLSFVALALFTAAWATADQTQASRPVVGELRTFAVPPGDSTSRVQLHHQGWIEANGKLLEASAFEPLLKAIGRTWTPAGVSSDEFAVPDLRGRSRGRTSSDNPFGVLGPGDLVTSGRPIAKGMTSGPITYWIFTGQDVSALDRSASR
jgi:Phage Tail Collar Domain